MDFFAFVFRSAGRGAMFCCGLQRVLAGAEPGNTEPVVSRDLRVLGGVLRAVPAVGGVAIAGGVAGSLSEPSGAYILKNREDVIIIL
ncbi:MAG: hypothetical protein C0508_25070 [Cyanobacteria bacterium PR.023]|nr:hypothetical protein [Cyanobacteria bacterium PR.023]